MDRIVGFVGEARDEDKKLIPERMDPEDIEGIKASEKALGANKIVSFVATMACFLFLGLREVRCTHEEPTQRCSPLMHRKITTKG